MRFQSKVGLIIRLMRVSADGSQEVIPTQFVFFSLAGMLTDTAQWL
jgi:hypothetical protein